jgi:hypothetical protein
MLSMATKNLFKLRQTKYMNYKTFEEFGLKFEYDSDCITCTDGSCHNNVISKKDGKEYNVHISMNSSKTLFTIHATQEANTESNSTIDIEFTDESEAVKFVCENFDWFKCF